MEFLIPFIGFIFITTITPGPNNFLLAASGIRFGFKRTLPHVVGIHFGVYTLVALCGLGLGQVLLAEPRALLILKVFGTVYLIYLAWKILGFQPGNQQDDDVAAPMTIAQALIFQFSNPKAWMMATAGLNISIAFNDSMLTAVLLLCAGFATLGIFCNFTWVLMGASLRDAITVPVYRYWINGGLALLTITTVLMFWMP
jgi:threonine/homoserine/homoserine lactone efflux protein